MGVLRIATIAHSARTSAPGRAEFDSELARPVGFGAMKIIVADKISAHGIKFLADTGWQVAQPAAAALAAELADADALVVRSATRVTDELLSARAAAARRRPRGRGRGQHRPGRRDAPRHGGDEHARAAMPRALPSTRWR